MYYCNAGGNTETREGAQPTRRQERDGTNERVEMAREEKHIACRGVSHTLTQSHWS